MTEVSTIRVSGWGKESTSKELSGLLIPSAYADGTDLG